MTPPKKRRKPSDQGLPISTWWRVGIVRRVDRVISKEKVSRSDFVERAVLTELARCETIAIERREGERRAS